MCLREVGLQLGFRTDPYYVSIIYWLSTLWNLIWSSVAKWLVLPCNLRHFTRSYDASCVVKWCKLQRIFTVMVSSTSICHFSRSLYKYFYSYLEGKKTRLYCLSNSWFLSLPIMGWSTPSPFSEDRGWVSTRSRVLGLRVLNSPWFQNSCDDFQWHCLSCHTAVCCLCRWYHTYALFQW